MDSLFAGPLSLGFLDGELRQVRLGSLELLQRVYVAVRDRTWATLSNQITQLELHQEESGFRAAWEARSVNAEVDFEWSGLIVGASDGSASFSFEGFARRDFLRNRIGFCVLHPMACAGSRCRFETSTSRGSGVFPELISPHQPFKDLAAFSHEVGPGVWFRIDFQGDRFEMEDQRNWTDASFKTYGTPLALPYPVAVRKGERIGQKLTFSLRDANDQALATRGEGSGARHGRHSRTPVSVEVGGPAGAALCALGFGLGNAGCEDRGSLDLAARLAPSHVRLDVQLDREGWDLAIERGGRIARALGAPLWCRIGSSGRGLPEELVQALVRCPSPPQALLVTRSSPPWNTETETVETLRADCHRADYHPRIGGGTDAWFAQLNRMRPDPSVLDFMFYPASPQVHAADSRSIIENLPGLGATVATALSISGGKPIVVSPLTLRPRCIPSLWEREADDPRQYAMFAALWSLMAVRQLSDAGAAAATFFELEGPRGLFPRGGPAAGASVPRLPYPAYFVFQELSAWRGAEMLKVESGDPCRIDALALRHDDRSVLLLCNMTEESQEALVEGPEFRAWEWLVPGHQEADCMIGARLVLPPYSICMARGAALQ